MLRKYYFANLERTEMLVTDDPMRALDYRNRTGWFEITHDEFLFVQSHSPNDPEWVARYGT